MANVSLGPGRRNEAGVPFGGIGAGKIEFCEDGRFTNVTTNNNLDSPIVDGLARMPLFPRIREGAEGSVLENVIRRQSVSSAEGLPGAFLAVHTPQTGAKLLKTNGRLAFTPIDIADIRYEARFPLAAVTYRGFGDLGIALEAFAPFDLLDDTDDSFHSSLPLALFAVTVKNDGAKEEPVSVAMSWQNLNGIGGYPMTLLNDPDPTPPVFRRDPRGDGLFFDHDPQSAADPRVLGNYSLRARSSSDRARTTFCAGWNPTGEGHEFWDAFSATGELCNADHGSTAGALACRVELAPGASATIVFSLAWWMPHLLAAETSWEHLVRPSGAPPAPTSRDRRDYGHKYSAWFADSWAVAEYGLDHREAIRARIARWQEPLANSSLPPRAVTGLCNDLCALVTNTWYTRDGAYAVNEAPTDMNGCFGTIDQRSVGNAAVALRFPQLNKAELSLFAADQIRAEDDPRRRGIHWDASGGTFTLPLDRAGAILHDIGWDHLEGGRTGDSAWPSLHWPEQTSHFVLQCYQCALWTGDAAWLESLYPKFKAALRFQARLDQDGDGVPDLWGAGSCTYDTELYPYYGASSYITGLFMAALRVGEVLATERGDDEFRIWAGEQFGRARRVMEDDLWNEKHGYYISWRDRRHAEWQGARAHGPQSTNCQISQLAGCWWADMLGLGDLVEPSRRRRALDYIGRHNVGKVAGCPADEYCLDGTAMQCMTALAMGNYAAHAIGAGLPDHGWAALEKIYAARYDHDGCPWDATLQWAGPGNTLPQWGRWYMSHPASWYVLLALGGATFDALRGSLIVTPSWPSAWGDKLRDIPLLLPGLTGRVVASRSPGLWSVTVALDQGAAGRGLHKVGTRLPDSFDPAKTQISLDGLDGSVEVSPERLVTVRSGTPILPAGGAFTISASHQASGSHSI